MIHLLHPRKCSQISGLPHQRELSVCLQRGTSLGSAHPQSSGRSFWISKVSGAHSRTFPNARLSPPIEGPVTPTWAVVQTDVLEPWSRFWGSLRGCWHGSFCPSAWQPETEGKGLAAQNETGPPASRVQSARVESPPLRGDHWESGPQGLERVGWGSTSVGSASRIQDTGCSVPLPVCWGLGMGSSAEAPRGEPLEGRDDAEHLGDVGGCCPFGSLCPG